MVTTSVIFEFLKQQNCYSIDRREVFSNDFSSLRRNLRIIIKNLNDGDGDAVEISRILRTRLSEWLTVPISYDENTFKDISILGEPKRVSDQWGRDIMEAYQRAVNSANKLSKCQNPMRHEIQQTIYDLKTKDKIFKIFCHGSAKIYFDSLISSSQTTIDKDIFIHSPKEYRETLPFDVLIKVGPLRPYGWGGCPDSLLTAPRFKTLIQFVWSGCWDEPGFGFDPVTGSAIIDGSATSSSISTTATDKQSISWTSITKPTGDNPLENGLRLIDEDEFQIFRTMDKAHDKRSATLIQVDNDHGILFPSRAALLSFDPQAGELDQIGYRLPGETLTAGMTLILPLLEEIGAGGLQAEEGKLSPIWKKRLETEFNNNPDDLCKKLYDGGINLLWLHSRVKDWCKLPTSVIHAPQKAEHFQILIEILNIRPEQSEGDKRDRAQWWRYAWREIQHSRGEAISEGRYEQGIVDEKIQTSLKDLRLEIFEKSKLSGDFSVEIEPISGIRGQLRFLKVVSVESGFEAPDAELRFIRDLREFEEWRV